MKSVTDVHAREILDSRGNPTVYGEITLSDGTVAGAAVPSGASTGIREALELRDGDPDRYMKKGVLKAVTNANGPLRDSILGLPISDQSGIDQAMIDADGTTNPAHRPARQRNTNRGGDATNTPESRPTNC